MKNWFKNIPFYYFLLEFFLGIWGIVTGLSLLHQLTAMNLRIVSIVWVAFHLVIFIKKLQFTEINVGKEIKKHPVISLYCFVILCLLFFQGFFSAPNTTDAMTYHLPRVMFWLSEKTVFPDSIYTINDFLSPFSDYLLLINFSVFSSDRFLFLPQFLFGMGSVYLIFTISFRLFGNQKWAIQSALWSALLPSVALQMVSTQVELATTFLALLSTTILIDCVRKQTVIATLGFPVSVSLTLLTKSTVIFFIPIWLLYFCLYKTWKKISFHQLVIGGIGILIGATMIGSFLFQNQKVYGHYLGELRFGSEIYSMMNEKISGGVMLSNLIRNSIIHLPFPIGTQVIQQGIESVHNFLDQPLNDPDTTWLNTEFRVQKLLFPQEDLIGNPVHFLLLLSSTVWMMRKKKKSTKMIWLIASFWIFWLGFSTVLKWQPWHSRLHLPIFFLGCLSFPIVLKTHTRLQKWLLYCSAALTFLLIIGNTSRPYFPYKQFETQLQAILPFQQHWPDSFLVSNRTTQYFLPYPEWELPTITALATVQSTMIHSVCFELIDGFEYPFWAILKDRLSSHVSTMRGCVNSDAEVQIITTDKSASYQEKQFECYPTEKQDKFLCIKVKNN